MTGRPAARRSRATAGDEGEDESHLNREALIFASVIGRHAGRYAAVPVDRTDCFQQFRVTGNPEISKIRGSFRMRSQRDSLSGLPVKATSRRR